MAFSSLSLLPFLFSLPSSLRSLSVSLNPLLSLSLSLILPPNSTKEVISPCLTQPRRCTSLLSSRCSCAVANFSRSSWVRSLMALLSSSPQPQIFKLQAHKRKNRFEVKKKTAEAEPCNSEWELKGLHWLRLFPVGRYACNHCSERGNICNSRSHAVSHVLKRNQRGSATRHGPSLVLESSGPSSCMCLVESASTIMWKSVVPGFENGDC